MVDMITVTVDSRLIDAVTKRGGQLVVAAVDGATGARIPVVRDTAGHVVLSGRVEQALAEGVTSVSLPDPSSSDLDPTGYAYELVLMATAQGTVARVVSDLAEATGGTVDFSDLVTTSPTSPSYAEQVNAAKGYAETATTQAGVATTAKADAETARDEAAASAEAATADAAQTAADRAAVEAIGTTTDSVMTSVLSDTGSGARGVLNDAFVQPGQPNTFTKKQQILTQTQALWIVQEPDLTGQAPVDCIDIDYNSSGDGVYVVNRGGDPAGYSGPTGGKANFNAYIPRFRDYDADAGNIYNGTVAANNGLTGLAVINQANTDKSRAAYLCSYGNAYALAIDTQINGGVPTDADVGTGGGVQIQDRSTASGLTIKKIGVPKAAGDVWAGPLPDAMVYLYAAAGQTIRAMQVYDTTASAFGYVLMSDGQASITKSLRVGNANQFAQVNSALHVAPTLGDLTSGAWSAAFVSPTFKPTSDIAKSPQAAAIQLVINDANASGNLTGTYRGATLTAQSLATSKTVTQLVGASAIAWANGAATVNLAQGITGQVQGSGTGSIGDGRALQALSPSLSGGKTLTTAHGVRIANQGNASVTNAYGLYIEAQSGASGTIRSIYVGGGDVELADAVNLRVGSTTGTKIGVTGGASGAKLGFWGATPVVQPVLATGASKTVDDLITFLQTIGLARQS